MATCQQERWSNWTVKLPNSGKKTSLEILLQMGFPKCRAEKAIASTADRSVQLATDWLLSHVNDPTLDLKCCREYIIYLCPVGELQHQLDKYWYDATKQCGWNQARNYFPHMTLTSFFELEDTKVSNLCAAIDETCKRIKNSPNKLKLDFFNTDNFIGLFVNQQSVPFVKELLGSLAQQANNYGVTLPEYNKEYHLSLAYKFSPDQKNEVNTLTDMAKNIDINAGVNWDLRLYSRDQRSKSCDTFKVVQEHTSRCPEELDLMLNDYIYVPADASQMGDWRIGTSWKTGVTAKFPLPYITRAPETDTWVLHSSVPVICGSGSSNCDMAIPAYAQVNKKKPKISGERQPRTVYIMRHGERVDFTFGHWMSWSFDHNGKYVRSNLNLPKSLPKRRGGYINFSRDCPLTELGKFQALNCGEYMKQSGVQIDTIYTSPSLRCIETSTKFVEGYGAADISLKIEPGLFEWLGWYKPTLPEFITPNELVENGYKIDLNYKPVWDDKNFNMEENIEMYYNRCYQTTRSILDKYHKHNGSILFVGHAGTMETCTRQLLGKTPRPRDKFQAVVKRIPYTAVGVVKEDTSTLKWSIVEPPIGGFANGITRQYDWRVLLS